MLRFSVIVSYCPVDRVKSREMNLEFFLMEHVMPRDIDARRKEMQRKMEEANNRIVRNSREFQKAVDDWANAAHEFALLSLIARIFDCYGRLIQRTPVDTGRARVGWHIEGQEDEWIPEKKQYEEAKGDGSAIISRELRKLGLDLVNADVIYIMNNVEYILKLEAFGGKHKDPGFVALFLQELRFDLEKAIEEVNRTK